MNVPSADPILDDPPALSAHDPRGMLGMIEAFPGQFAVHPPAESLGALKSLPPAPRLWVAAMGGSAFAGEMLAAALASCGVPATVVRGYSLPATSRPEDWLVALSYSGDTEETLQCFEEAGVRGLPRIAITSGGKLAGRAANQEVPLLPLPPGYPPRAAAGFAYAAAIEVGRRLIRSAHATAPELPDPRLLAAHLSAARVRWGSGVPLAENEAKQLARFLSERLPVVYGGVGAPEAALTRWRTQLNENAKVLCHTAVLPELNHNEVVGWGGRDSWTERAAVVILREGSEDSGTARRLTATRRWLERSGVVVREVEGEGASALERLWWLCHLGDYVSVYLAALRGVDPTPVGAIDEFKSLLAEGPA